MESVPLCVPTDRLHCRCGTAAKLSDEYESLYINGCNRLYQRKCNESPIIVEEMQLAYDHFENKRKIFPTKKEPFRLLSSFYSSISGGARISSVDSGGKGFCSTLRRREGLFRTSYG